jgi:hypothetical protein
MKFLTDILAKASLVVDGAVTLNSVANSSVDTDRFLVIESNVVKYRTGTQLLSDIGAAAAAAGLPPGGTAGQILAKIDATNYNAEWIDNYTSNVRHLVKLASAMTVGTPVYVSGSTGQSGTNMIVSPASNTSEATSSKTLGLLVTGGATNDIVFVVTEGLLGGLNTNSAAAGDPVWLGPNGTLLYGLINKPVAPVHMVFIGVVTRAQQNNGEIFVKVQNGYELEELHNVLITDVGDKHFLYRDGPTNLWKNASISTILGYTPASSTSISGTVNRVAKFTSTSAVGDSQIFDNGTNVSIGTLTPITTSILTLTGTSVLTKSIFLDSTWSYQTSFSMRNGNYYTEFNLGGASKNTSEGGPGSFQIAHYNASNGQYIIPITFFANGNIAFAGGTAAVPSDQGQTLQVQGSTRISALAGTGTRVVVANASGVLSTGAVSSSIITGSGTTNYVSKWTPDGVTLGNSQIFDNGTSIGVGLTSPLAKFHVNGSIRSSAFEDQVFTYAGAVQQTYTTGLGFNSDVITKDGTSATFVMANNIATQVKHTGVGSNYVANYALGASAEVGGTTANALIYGAGGYFISRRRYSDDISTNGNNGMYGVVARVIIDPPAPSTMRTATLYAIDAGLTLNSGTTITAAGVEILANFGTSNSSTPGIVTDYFGIRIRGTIGSATGGTAIVTNYYGLYIANPTINATGNTATRWAIYSLDTSASYIRGSLLVGTTTNANYKVDINGTLRSSDSAYFATSSGNVTIGNLAGTGTRLVTADANGVLGVSGLASGIVTGSGITNYVARWTSSSALGTGVLFDNGSFVGVGVTSNFAGGPRLYVSKTTASEEILRVDGQGGAGCLIISNTASSVQTVFYNGNIGVGTLSPQQKFVVSNVGAEGLEFIPAPSVNSNQIQSYNRSTSAFNSLVLRASEYNVQIGTNPALFINSSSNVGIGTTSPTQKLVISDSIDGSLITWVQNENVNGYSVLRLGSTMQQSAAIVRNGSSQTSYAGANSLNVYTLSTQPIGLVTNNLLRMIVTGDGNVGVGIASPLYKIHVLNTAGESSLFLESGTTTQAALYLANANNAIFNDNSTTNNLKFFVNSATRMIINSSGNVGIGTTTPNVRLEVAGLVRVTGTNGFSIGADGGQNRIQYSTSTFSRFALLSSGDGYMGLTAKELSIGATYGGIAPPSSGIIVEGNVGIGTSSPGASAKLDITSTTQGFLPPRMTAAQRAAISSPAIGLVVYQTDGNEGLWIYTNGNGWKALAIVL